MPNKTQFRYVTAYSTYKDTIRVTYTKRYIHPEDPSLNRDYTAEADLAIIVEATKVFLMIDTKYTTRHKQIKQF